MHTESRPHLEEERRKGHTNSFNKSFFCRYIETILSIWVYVCHTPGLLFKNEKVQRRNLKPASRTLEVDIFFSHTSSEWWILWSREDARRGGYITNLFWGEIIWMSTWGLLRGDFMTGQPNCWLGYKSIATTRVDWWSSVFSLRRRQNSLNLKSLRSFYNNGWIFTIITVAWKGAVVKIDIFKSIAQFTIGHFVHCFLHHIEEICHQNSHHHDERESRHDMLTIIVLVIAYSAIFSNSFLFMQISLF